jgi:hypothetical protein
MAVSIELNRSILLEAAVSKGFEGQIRFPCHVKFPVFHQPASEDEFLPNTTGQWPAVMKIQPFRLLRLNLTALVARGDGAPAARTFM